MLDWMSVSARADVQKYAVLRVAGNDIAGDRRVRDAVELDAVTRVGDCRGPRGICADLVVRDCVGRRGAVRLLNQDTIARIARDHVAGDGVKGCIVQDQAVLPITQPDASGDIDSDVIALDQIAFGGLGVADGDALIRVARNDVAGARGRPADRIAGRPEDLNADAITLRGGAIGSADIAALNQVVSARREDDPRAGPPVIASPSIVLDPALSERTQSDDAKVRPIDLDQWCSGITFLAHAVDDHRVGDMSATAPARNSARSIEAPFRVLRNRWCRESSHG